MGLFLKDMFIDLATKKKISLFENISELSGAQIEDEIRQSIENYEPRVELINVTAIPDYDNNQFDAVVVYKIIGMDIPPQELSFVLQPTR